MRRIKDISRALCLLAGILLLYFPLSVFAYETRVYDEAGVLSDRETSNLEETLADISETYQCDVIIYTDEYSGQSAYQTAAGFYQRGGFGYGSDKDGILLFVAVRSREWAIYLSGAADWAFTQERQSRMSSAFRSDLSSGDYAGAFETFADYCDRYLAQAETDGSYDGYQSSGRRLSGSMILIGIGIGLLLATIVTLVFRAQLKTVHTRSEASDYVRRGSFRLTRQEDLFLYSQVTRVRKPRQEEHRSGGGGHGGPGPGRGGSSGSF